MKWAVPGRNRTLFRRVFSIALPRSKRIGRVRFLVLLPLLVFLVHKASILFDTCGILGWHRPQTLKTNVGLLLRMPLASLTTNFVSAISRMCLTHQRWQATMTVHIWSQLICVTQRNNRKWVSGEWRIIGNYRFEMLHFDAELERTHN